MSTLLLHDAIETEDAIMLLQSIEADLRLQQRIPRLEFSKLSDAECLKRFRFDRNGIMALHHQLKIPENYTCANRTSATGLEGVLILLRRLTYPNRLCELAN